MGATVGPRTASYPRIVFAPLLQAKWQWTDPWRTVPEFRFLSASRGAGSGERSECRFAAPYGPVCFQWQTAPVTRRPLAGLWGMWVRLVFWSDAGPSVQFIGQVAAEGDMPEGLGVGEQLWTAYGPERILERVSVSESYWLITDEAGVPAEQLLGWVPKVNDLDDRGVLVGNRTASPSNGSYLYEGQTPGATPKLWTNRQYADYLLKRFVRHENGPTWQLGGQVETLDFSTHIDTAGSRTVHEWLRELIPPDRGLDFYVRPAAADGEENEEGFEVCVFSLTARDWRFGGKTLPRNPRVHQVRLGRSLDLAGRIEYDGDKRFAKVRVRGKRAVVCCSLAGSECDLAAIKGTLDRGWSTTLETEYKSAAGVGDGQSNDRFRQDDRFEAVFQRFVASNDWKPITAGCVPAFDEAGQYVAEPAEPPGYQKRVLKTLDHLPLAQGTDYSADPPTNKNDPTATPPEFLKPVAYVSDPEESDPSEADIYWRADELGISLSVLTTTLGVQLGANPNHRLAAGSFGGAAATAKIPEFDWNRLVITVAFESDQRPTATAAIDGARPEDGVLDIVDNDLEFWLLAPHTVIGLNKDGTLKTSGDKPRVLRSDHERLAEKMIGILARHWRSRVKVALELESLEPWGDLVGAILSAVDAGGVLHDVESPITRVAWQANGDGDQVTVQTTISAGFAG